VDIEQLISRLRELYGPLTDEIMRITIIQARRDAYGLISVGILAAIACIAGIALLFYGVKGKEGQMIAAGAGLGGIFGAFTYCIFAQAILMLQNPEWAAIMKLLGKY
jgi:hypothetical protein